MLNDETAANSYHLYLEGGGEMGALTRAHDWSKTVLGTPDQWSRNLLTTLSIILHSRYPKLLWWGSELTQFYNDAYRPSLGNEGKHPTALGQAAEICWQEIWEVIKPLIDQVMSGGEATWHEDQLIPIYRNNRLEEVYWTFCYSRVIDVDGKIGGVLVTCNETTEKVLQKQKVSQTLIELAASKARLSNLITQAQVGIGVLTGRALIIETANDKILQFWGKSESVIGETLANALPELEGQPFLKILDDVYTTGIDYCSNETPVFLERNGKLDKYYFDIVYQAIKSTTGQTESILVLATDLTEQVNARQAIEESSLQFRQMADSIIQMVWVTDADGMHEYYNKRWYDFTGSNFEDSEGEKWNEFFHPDDRELAFQKWKHSLATGQPYEVEYRLKNFAGEYVWVLGRAAPFYNAEGELIKWFGTCTDIHEQKLLQQQKDDFISIASHELKTPITTLKASIQLIDRLVDDESPKVKSLVERANRIADKVSHLVGDLLNASKFNHGQLHLNKTNFQMAKMIEECCEHINLEGKYLVNIVGNKTLMVDADMDRIGQVITNFVSNAIKYAPASTEINISIEKIMNTVKVAVHDKGTGIVADKIPYLFDRFYRVDSSGSQYSGLGLGLYISAEIIKKHSGKIGVDSEIGKGSSFWFTLPINS